VCLSTNAGELDDCASFCKSCVREKGCWVSTGDYAGSTDQTCESSCYDEEICAEKLGSSSDFCTCGIEACVLGCPEQCGDSLMTTCLVDCKTADSKTATEWNTFCEDCVDSKGCWTAKASYGNGADVTCWNSCYSKCGEDLPSAGSSLCDCSLDECILGCPEDCSGADLFTTCV
jgi:hypothetical protein